MKKEKEYRQEINCLRDEVDKLNEIIIKLSNQLKEQAKEIFDSIYSLLFNYTLHKGVYARCSISNVELEELKKKWVDEE